MRVQFPPSAPKHDAFEHLQNQNSAFSEKFSAILRRETATQSRYEFFRAIATLVVVTIGCLFSIAGAAAGRVAEAILGYFLYRPHMDRMAGTTKGELERVYSESFLLTVVAVAPAFVLMMFCGWAADTSPMLVASAVALGIAAWFGLMVVRRHPAVLELQRMIAGIKEMRQRTRAG